MKHVILTEEPIKIPCSTSDPFDLKIELDRRLSSALAFNLDLTRQGDRRTRISVDFESKTLSFDRRFSSKGNSSVIKTYNLQMDSDIVTLNVAYGTSALEVYIDGNANTISNIIYPGDECTGIKMSSTEGITYIRSINAFNRKMAIV